MTYQRQPIKAPKLSGPLLRGFVSTMESAVGRALVNKLLNDSGIEVFREKSAGLHPPLQHALPYGPPATEPGSPVANAARVTDAPSVAKGAKLETVAAFRAAYANNTSDPVAVIQRIHQHIDALDGGADRMGFFISRKPDDVLAAARASAERLRNGKALSVLDGIPVVIKDEIDMAGFATTLGTTFLTTPVNDDCTVVARLKAAGALILGKANMNEIGINPIGLNPHHGAARNPYDRTRITGGSSSASASTVAAGIAPLSIGLDGGGSIRIPAGICGVVGLKATFMRISEQGVPPLCWNVGHIGPLGLTVADVAAAYSLLAGPDPKEPHTAHQPPPHVSSFENMDLKGVRLGICWAYFEDADHDVVRRCRDAVRAMTDAGATIVEIPPPDLNTILWSHSTIILSEMATSMRQYTQEDSHRFGLDSRTNLAIGKYFAATDYVHAMRHRHRLTAEYLELMKTCDLIVTPNTACTAPEIPERTLPDGESNLPVVDQLMRFIRIGNVTGFPGISLPAGYDSKGLPVSVHVMGRPWEEHLLFRAGRVIEATVERRLPKVHVSALS